MLKIDDDVFLALDDLIYFLQENKTLPQNFIMGRVLQHKRYTVRYNFAILIFFYSGGVCHSARGRAAKLSHLKPSEHTQKGIKHCIACNRLALLKLLSRVVQDVASFAKVTLATLHPSTLPAFMICRAEEI